MKISDTEINAANYQLTRYEEGRGNIQAVKEALEAAYTVRKQRKAAKRERQRKEKDKQVVESVKPTGLFTSLIGEGNWTADKAAAWGNLEALAGIASAVGQYGKVEPTPSKAPEWDGNASAFDAAMKPKA